ncbi:hypothetical protein HHI36_004780, partial [Cryptolaemus montrouzieri]
DEDELALILGSMTVLFYSTNESKELNVPRGTEENHCDQSKYLKEFYTFHKLGYRNLRQEL